MAIVMAVGGCASMPSPPGTDAFFVSTHAATQGSQPTFAFSVPTGPFPDPPLEASCTATNDRGSWTIAAPGKFQVTTSREPLKITCSREGYADMTVELRCMNVGASTAGAAAYGLVMVSGPLALFLLPVVAVTAAAAKNAQQKSIESGDCDYTMESKLHIWMKRSG